MVVRYLKNAATKPFIKTQVITTQVLVVRVFDCNDRVFTTVGMIKICKISLIS